VIARFESGRLALALLGHFSASKELVRATQVMRAKSCLPAYRLAVSTYRLASGPHRLFTIGSIMFLALGSKLPAGSG
jgi:hypothetical protein